MKSTSNWIQAKQHIPRRCHAIAIRPFSLVIPPACVVSSQGKPYGALRKIFCLRDNAAELLRSRVGGEKCCTVEMTLWFE